MKTGTAKVYKHLKAGTLYLPIPSHVAQDSSCPIKDGDVVSVTICEDAENEVRGRGIFIAFQLSKTEGEKKE